MHRKHVDSVHNANEAHCINVAQDYENDSHWVEICKNYTGYTLSKNASMQRK